MGTIGTAGPELTKTFTLEPGSAFSGSKRRTLPFSVSSLVSSCNSTFRLCDSRTSFASSPVIVFNSSFVKSTLPLPSPTVTVISDCFETIVPEVTLCLITYPLSSSADLAYSYRIFSEASLNACSACSTFRPTRGGTLHSVLFNVSSDWAEASVVFSIVFPDPRLKIPPSLAKITSTTATIITAATIPIVVKSFSICGFTSSCCSFFFLPDGGFAIFGSLFTTGTSIPPFQFWSRGPVLRCVSRTNSTSPLSRITAGEYSSSSGSFFRYSSSGSTSAWRRSAISSYASRYRLSGFFAVAFRIILSRLGVTS